LNKSIYQIVKILLFIMNFRCN